MRRTVLALAALSLLSGGCLTGHYRAGAALSGVMTLSSAVDTDNPVLVDAYIRVDKAIFQLEASYGYQSYTYDYKDTLLVDQTGDLEVYPLVLTARIALGKPKGSGVRKLWLAGAGVVYNTVEGTDYSTLDQDNYDAVRISFGHEWDWGKLLVLIEGVYQQSRDMVADGVTFDEAVDISLEGAITRVAVGYRF